MSFHPIVFRQLFILHPSFILHSFWSFFLKVPVSYHPTVLSVERNTLQLNRIHRAKRHFRAISKHVFRLVRVKTTPFVRTKEKSQSCGYHGYAFKECCETRFETTSFPLPVRGQRSRGQSITEVVAFLKGENALLVGEHVALPL